MRDQPVGMLTDVRVLVLAGDMHGPGTAHCSRSNTSWCSFRASAFLSLVMRSFASSIDSTILSGRGHQTPDCCFGWTDRCHLLWSPHVNSQDLREMTCPMVLSVCAHGSVHVRAWSKRTPTVQKQSAIHAPDAHHPRHGYICLPHRSGHMPAATQKRPTTSRGAPVSRPPLDARPATSRAQSSPLEAPARLA